MTQSTAAICPDRRLERSLDDHRQHAPPQLQLSVQTVALSVLCGRSRRLLTPWFGKPGCLQVHPRLDEIVDWARPNSCPEDRASGCSPHGLEDLDAGRLASFR